MDNAERFLNAFALIEKECYKIINDAAYLRFYQLVKEAAKRDEIIRKYEITLQQYGDLRNAIVHQRTDGGEIIAIPVDYAVKEIEHIANVLSKPPLVKDHFLKKVQFCNLNENISLVYSKMKQLGTSKLPICEDGSFIGIITLEMITEAIFNNQQSFQSYVVEDVYKPQYKKEKVYFVSKNAKIHSISNEFEKALKKGYHILAMLVTKTGRQDEKIEGIITVADLPEIMKLIN